MYAVLFAYLAALGLRCCRQSFSTYSALAVGTQASVIVANRPVCSVGLVVWLHVESSWIRD